MKSGEETVVAALMPGIAILGAALVALTGCGTSATSGIRGEDSQAGRPVATSNSDWEPGDAGMRALVGGTLRAAKNGCPYLASGTRLWVVWPEGFQARIGSDGRLVLLAPDGAIVAHEGDYIEAGGGLAVGRARPGMPCIPSGVELTAIQSEIVVQPRDSR
jgi:hypothetical protein